MGVITLITDFGTQDGYAGAVKGVIQSLAPDAHIIDVTHEIPPQDVAAAAFALAQSAPYYPPGTVHVVVVDPGVGGRRRSVVVDDGRQRYVGPDNGVFSLAVPVVVSAHEITAPLFRRGTVAATFHGRDVFAPAAARLASGSAPSEAGPAVELAGRLEIAPIVAKGNKITGHVIHVDRFGNCITDIPAARLAASAKIRVAGRVLALSRTYEDVTRGRPVAYVGSSGTLEIAVRDGSAARRLRLKRGAVVSVTP